jgi:lysophospholipase
LGLRDRHGGANERATGQDETDRAKTTPSFQWFKQPYPIITASSIPPIGPAAAAGPFFPGFPIPINGTTYEFNPYEWGTYDPSLARFIPVEYTGSSLRGGAPVNSTSCVTGFDNFGFIIGTSSSFFTSLLGPQGGNPSIITPIQSVQNVFARDVLADAGINAEFPNAFQGINPGGFAASSEALLQLSDGGLAGEEVPLSPLLVKARGIEVILAVDSSPDTTQGWANGTSFFATQARSRALPPGTIDMPPLPADLNAISQDGFKPKAN